MLIGKSSFNLFNVTAAAVLAFILVSSPLLALAPAPSVAIHKGTDRVLEILRNRQKGGPTLKQRRHEILQIVDEYFDFAEMGKRALGRPWKDQPPAKQQEFAGLFEQLLFNYYVDRVETNTEGNEQVVYDQEKIEGDNAIVKTRIVGGPRGEVSVDYRMFLQDGQWKVYDVVIEGISLVNNYRQQFNAILSNGSFDSLLGRMREKVTGAGM